MEARDEPDRIRPLPPDLPDDAAPGQAPPSKDRRWVPLAVAGGALVLFGAIAGLFGGSGGNDTPTPPVDALTGTTVPAIGGPAPAPTTTTTLPPLLEERVPELPGPVQIVYRPLEGTSTDYVVWRLGTDAPGTPLSNGAEAVAARFDVSGVNLAWLTTGRRTTLWLDRPPNAEPVVVDVAGVAWHPSEPGALAWIGRRPGGERYRLFVGSVGPGAGLEIRADLGPVPTGARLAGWGTWGFALEMPAPSELRQWQVPDPAAPGTTQVQFLVVSLLLDPEGVPFAAFPGRTHASSFDGHLIVRPMPEAFAAARDAGLDVAEMGVTVEPTILPTGPGGEPVGVVGPDLAPTGVWFDPPSADARFHFSPDGSRAAALGTVDDRFAIVTEGIVASERRITSVPDVDVSLGYSRDGRYLLLHDRASGDLVFHDWNRGASYRLPFDGWILAAFA